MRRSKFVLNRHLMHRTLGLPDGVRAVSMHVTADPDEVHVVVEGDEVPAYSGFGGDQGEQAAVGVVSSPALRGLLVLADDAAQIPVWGPVLQRLVGRDRALLADRDETVKILRYSALPAGPAAAMRRLVVSSRADSLDDEVARAVQFWRWVLEGRDGSSSQMVGG